MQRSARRASAESTDDTVITTDVEVVDPDLLLRLSGPGGSHLRILEDESGVSLGLRGNTIRVQGSEDAVTSMERILMELLEALRHRELSEAEIARSARTLRTHPEVKLRSLLDDVVLTTAGHRIITPKGITQQEYVHAIRTHDIVFGIGPAGTGKTYLAMAMAVRALEEQRVKRIILTRPAVEAGERLGFLPGALEEKINPYLRPLHDALYDMMNDAKVMALMERGTIEVAPLAFMRGRTLNDSFVILDEAQNTTPEQMKMFLTRLGFDSKTVITGDVTQIDLPVGKQSGLKHTERILREIEGIRFVWFSHQDVVRHPLVQKIVQAYEADEDDNPAQDVLDPDS